MIHPSMEDGFFSYFGVASPRFSSFISFISKDGVIACGCSFEISTASRDAGDSRLGEFRFATDWEKVRMVDT